MNKPYLDNSIVFCDFDGTITVIETFVGMIETFAPELSAILLPKLFNREITLKDGVTQLLESIPSETYPAMIAYAQDKPIRKGLTELLDFLDDNNIPMVVISGGLKDMVKMVLQREGILHRVKDIVGLDLDTTEEYLKVNSAFVGDTELVAKGDVIEKYPCRWRIAIGDSLTDINIALKADLVFARDRLIEYLETYDKPYFPWDDFTDIKNHLQLYT